MHGAEGVNRKNGIDEIGTTDVVKLSVIIDTAAVKQKNLIQFIPKLGFVTTEKSIMEIQRRRYFLPESNTWNVNLKMQISKLVLQENKAHQIFRKTNISYPLIRTRA